jgi:LAO/AO transport system kinase
VTVRPPAMTAAARRILRHDRGELARTISAVENHDPRVLPTIRALYPHTGKARIIGIAGPLGVGKSSLVNVLLDHLRELGKTVGVIGVDPSSPFSGGSVLGDRIRIDRPSRDQGVFFRSMASRGHAGGIAATTREVSRLLDAFGFDVVLVETVGSGQVDVEIRQVASTSVVVLVPHLGDEVQSLKAGLFEIADVFCVNKADLPGADGAARYLMEMAGLALRSDGWRPKVVQASAFTRTGIPQLWAAVEAHEAHLDATGQRATAQRARLQAEIVELARDSLVEEWSGRLHRDTRLRRLLDEVERREVDPHTAADRLLRELGPRRSRGA